ncbi:MAG: S9 family peptidase [Candidatus Solibacter usitatus]|nr:S9 family peptidase [Candidatus Solibacter usitatus]
MRRRLLAALLLLPAAFAAKTPLTHETMWLMKRAGAPAVSPDGKWVVFPVVEPAYDAKDEISDLWIVPADGAAAPRRLTFSKSAESGVAWSPDSRRIAFTARRDGDEAPQVYVLDIAGGGEAVRVTSISGGAGSPQWRPDGKALLFSSSVYPGAMDDEANRRIAAERKARKYNARVYEGFPIRYWDHWLDERQAHLFVQPLELGAKARDLLAGTKLASERGFGGVLGDSGEELRGAWAPDGQSVVFAATTNRHVSAYAFSNTRLFTVPSAGGEPRALTTGEDSYSRPVFSPDGKALYALHNRKSEFVYSLTRIARFGWPGAAERTLVSDSLDRSVSSFSLTPDSAAIFLLAEEAGHEKLYQLPAAGGPARLAYDLSLGVYTNLAVARDVPVLVANWESAVNPAEVVRIDLDSRRHRALSSFNAERAAAIDWQPPRHFWFTSKSGRKIHNMIVLPPGFDESKKYPLFVLIHGGANAMWRDQFFLRWNYHLLGAPGYVLLLTNYTGSTGFGEKFAQQIQGDPLAGPGEELNQAADEAIRRFPFIDAARQAAGGASYGGHLANWLEATTTRYKCLISHAGLINLESQWGTSDTIYSREITNGGPVWEQGTVWREQNPIRRARNFRTPMMLTVGEHDFRVPLNQTLENWSVLQRLQVPSRLIVFPDANHWITKAEDSRYFYQEVHAWLKRWL